MRRPFPALPAAAATIAALTVVTAFFAVPLVVRTALGLVTVFVLPGFAVERALHARPGFEPDAAPFVWLGVSLAISVVTAVALAASPIGISRESFAVALGGLTAPLALYAGLRSMMHDTPHEVVSDG
jgi:uncharacterized membrane protein